MTIQLGISYLKSGCPHRTPYVCAACAGDIAHTMEKVLHAIRKQGEARAELAKVDEAFSEFIR